MTMPASVYPATVDDLLPEVRAFIAELGAMPSRNQVMRRFKVGAPKATAVLEAAQAALDDAARRAGTQVVTSVPVADTPAPAATTAPEVTAPVAEVAVHADPVPTIAVAEPALPAKVRAWPVYMIALPAFVAIWSGWVGLGTLTGFGVVHPLPGIWDSFALNTAITLPIGVEVYAAYALRAWLSGDRVPATARRFAKWSAITSLLVGSAGQVAYHLMESAGMTSAPWQITTAVSCLPVAVLGMGAALAHLLHNGRTVREVRR